MDNKYHALTEDQLKVIHDILVLGLNTDGGHHKQWALVEIGKVLGFDVDDFEDEAIAP